MTNRNKRKKSKSFDDQDEIESIIQKAITSIRRTGKIVRTFHCQKMVRKIKQIQTQSNPSKDKIQTIEEQLEHWKNFDLNLLVETSKQSCQLLEFQKNESFKEQSISTLSQMDQDVLTSIMEHKRMKECFQTIRESIAIYKNKVLRREQRYHEKRHKKRKKNSSKSTSKKDSNEYNDYIGASGLFIESLSGKIDPTTNDDYDDNEQETYPYEYQETTKKNRPGQRARNAKKLAIQARKEGKTWNSSNWRPKKNNENDQSTQSTKTTKQTTQKPNVKASDIANTGSNWKSDGSAHPSWLAAQRQKKEGIVQFTGTKITFN